VSRLLAVAIVALVPAVALAHGRSLSYSSWELDEHGAKVEFRIPLLELTRLPPTEAAGPYVTAHLQLLAGGSPCPAAPARPIPGAPDGWAVFRWTVTCPVGDLRSIRSDLTASLVSSHIHFVRVALANGDVRERFLVEAEPLWTLEEKSAPHATAPAHDLVRYVRLGVEHILTGWDHLAFLCALLLLAGSLREVTTLVTGFTIAHSATLGLAVLGILRPEPVAVEALIGFSIALVAAENLWLLGGRDPIVPAGCLGLLLLASLTGGRVPRDAWLGLCVFSLCHFGLLSRENRLALVRAAVAFAFGLVHGFGFAGVLMEAGLPAERLAPALFGFNLGVEVGQLGVVVLAWPLLLAVARRDSAWHQRLAEAGSTAILALGVFWVVTRGWG